MKQFNITIYYQIDLYNNNQGAASDQLHTFFNTLNIKNMKTLFLSIALLLSFSVTAQKVEKKLYYCVQVVSTENPQLLQPLMFMAMDDRAMVEKAIVNGREYYRVMFIYETIEEQDSALHNWRHQWKDSIRVTRNEEQIKKMFPLFTELK